MAIIDILVTKVPNGGLRVGLINCNRHACILTRTIRDIDFVCDKIEEEMRSGSFVCRHERGALLEIEIHDKRSVRSVVRKISELVETHKNSTKSTTLPTTRSNV